MTTRNSVICPVDFSDASRGALRYAAVVANHLKAELTVLTVTDPLLREAAELSSSIEHLPEAINKELRRFVTQDVRGRRDARRDAARRHDRQARGRNPARRQRAAGQPRRDEHARADGRSQAVLRLDGRARAARDHRPGPADPGARPWARQARRREARRQAGARPGRSQPGHVRPGQLGAGRGRRARRAGAAGPRRPTRPLRGVGPAPPAEPRSRAPVQGREVARRARASASRPTCDRRRSSPMAIRRKKSPRSRAIATPASS